jgi:hypothetical protein
LLEPKTRSLIRRSWDWNGGGVYLPSGVDNNRLIGNYFDFCTLVVDDPQDFLFTDAYFLFEFYAQFGDFNHDQSFISLRPTKPNVTVSGLRITNCQIDIGDSRLSVGWVQINNTAFKNATVAPYFNSSHNNVVEGNVFNANEPRQLVGTRISQSLHKNNATSWTFDLSRSLLFAGIQGKVLYSLAADDAASAPPQHWLARNGMYDGVVEVRSVSPASARVHVEVDQSSYRGGVM